MNVHAYPWICMHIHRCACISIYVHDVSRCIRITHYPRGGSEPPPPAAAAVQVYLRGGIPSLAGLGTRFIQCDKLAHVAQKKGQTMVFVYAGACDFDLHPGIELRFEAVMTRGNLQASYNEIDGTSSRPQLHFSESACHRCTLPIKHKLVRVVGNV